MKDGYIYNHEWTILVNIYPPNVGMNICMHIYMKIIKLSIYPPNVGMNIFMHIYMHIIKLGDLPLWNGLGHCLPSKGRHS